MSKTYTELKKIKDSTRLDYFVMAISYILDIGYDRASKITENDIANAEGNGLMPKEFVQWIMQTARQITEAVESGVEIVQFCMAEDIFEIGYFADKLSRQAMEHMLRSRIDNEKRSVEDSADTEYFEGVYDCDIYNFSLLGYSIPELEEESA